MLRASHSAAAAWAMMGARSLLGPSLSRAASTSAFASTPAASGSQPRASSSSPSTATPPIFVACVLERLPVVMRDADAWEAEHAAWRRADDLRQGFAKEFPQPAARTAAGGAGGPGGDSKPAASQQQLRTFRPVPVATAADASDDHSSMRRRLDQRLYLLVRRPPLPGEPGATPLHTDDAAAQGGVHMDDAASGSSTGNGAVWQFPAVCVGNGEDVRSAAQRALASAVGRSHAVYFIGNAPMAHLPAMQQQQQQQQQAQQHTGGGGGTATFFMLAQVVGDPWDVLLKPGCGADAHAWVTRDELPAFVGDARMRDLAARMLV